MSLSLPRRLRAMAGTSPSRPGNCYELLREAADVIERIEGKRRMSWPLFAMLLSTFALGMSVRGLLQEDCKQTNTVAEGDR